MLYMNFRLSYLEALQEEFEFRKDERTIQDELKTFLSIVRTLSQEMHVLKQKKRLKKRKYKTIENIMNNRMDQKWGILRQAMHFDEEGEEEEEEEENEDPGNI